MQQQPNIAGDFLKSYFVRQVPKTPETVDNRNTKILDHFNPASLPINIHGKKIQVAEVKSVAELNLLDEPDVITEPDLTVSKVELTEFEDFMTDAVCSLARIREASTEADHHSEVSTLSYIDSALGVYEEYLVVELDEVRKQRIEVQCLEQNAINKEEFGNEPEWNGDENL